MVRQGEHGLGDIAVFCRVTALTRPLEQAFRRLKIPHQIVGGVAFYERQEVKDVVAYLSLLVNRKDDLAFVRDRQRSSARLGEDLARASDRRRAGAWSSAPGDGGEGHYDFQPCATRRGEHSRILHG